jgi:hypothetical protein
MITPTNYPKRRQTLLGLPAFQADLAKVEKAFDDPLFPIKYTCTLTKGSMLLSGIIVTYLELELWLDMKGFGLFSVDSPPELALQTERTQLG